MSNEKRYYVPDRMMSWNSISANGFGIKPDPDLGIGFLVVFDNAEELAKNWPDISFFVLVEDNKSKSEASHEQ